MTRIFLDSDLTHLRSQYRKQTARISFLLLLGLLITIPLVLFRYEIGMTLSLVSCITITSLSGCFWAWHYQTKDLPNYNLIQLYENTKTANHELLKCSIEDISDKYETRNKLLYRLIAVESIFE